MNTIIKKFAADGTWTCPAGVTQVEVIANPRNILCMDKPPGSSHMVCTSEGSLWAWGRATSIVDSASPINIMVNSKFKRISTGFGYNLGLAFDGTAYSWGANSEGQLGDGTVVQKSTPTLVVGGLKFKEIFASTGLSAGITTEGTLYSWGSNGSGQLGDGTTIPKSSPVLSCGGMKFKTVSLGLDYAMGISSTGEIYSWGRNNNGQLGDGTVASKSSPVLVLGGLKFTQISAGSAESYGILEDGTAYSWGYNSLGNLGHNDTLDKSSPVLIVGGLKFKEIKAGYAAAALTHQGDAYTWGVNNNGQLGQNTRVSSTSSPAAVIGGLKFNRILNSSSYMIALTSEGTAYSWGVNLQGTLGEGIYSKGRSSPVAVVGGLKFLPLTKKENPISSVFAVTPGTTYVVKVSDYYPSFNSEDLGVVNGVESIVLKYIA